ncbi:serine hydrolase [Caballeronia hypogeia]|nr:serine hydrolase [Caballeronia hypogeia]
MGTTPALEESLTREVNGLSFDRFIEQTRKEYGVPGAVVVAASDQGIEYLGGFGVRRQGDSASVDGDTRFQIASMSKFVAATALGVLIDKKGAVSWDAPVRTFSPETVLAEPYGTQNVTLRDFFAHRTGLPKYGDLLPHHFLRWRVVEKNGALNGVRSIVALIPELRLGIAIFANKQMTVFPEAVRAEFLERVLAPSGRDLQTQIREEQAGWNSLLLIPTPPDDSKPLERDRDAFIGTFVSLLYGRLVIDRDGEDLAVRIANNEYPARLRHWSGDTFLIGFDDPDIAPGLLTFQFEKGAFRATSFNGSEVPHFNTVNYGHFDRSD